MSWNAYTTKYTFDLGVLGEVECTVDFNYSPGRPAVNYLRNGDPGYPADPSEIEITAIRSDMLSPQGCASLLVEVRQDDDLLNKCEEYAIDKDFDDESGRADYLYDMKKEAA